MSTTKPAIRYYVTMRGQEHILELTETEKGYEVLLDGKKARADLALLAGNSLYSLLLDGHSRELVLQRELDRTLVSLDGERIEVRVQDELSHALAVAGDTVRAGRSTVVAPMPGVVVEIPVSPGDEIEAGDRVIIVEAMKMQNELCSETAGIVESVAVQRGATVNGGDVLVVVKPKASPAEAPPRARAYGKRP
jgi:biotin carboxyl carrier protein